MENGGLPQPQLPQPQSQTPMYPQPEKPKKLIADTRSWVFLGIVIVLAVLLAVFMWIGSALFTQQTVLEAPSSTSKSSDKPSLTSEVVAKGYANVWDVAFLPTKEMIFTERKGTLHLMKDGKDSVLSSISDIYAQGEGGLMGLAVDPQFVSNRFIYTCFNSTKGGPDIRVVRWHVANDLKSLDGRNDIVTGIPSNTSGRHSGCKLAFGPDGYLWIGTGDTAQGDISIQPKSLGGKILRVDRAGEAATGNVGGNFDARVYSYGHRNVQGLAFFLSPQQGALGVSIEHGPDVNDEINLLKPGNFGWAPAAGGYNENIPMTDTRRFLDAIPAIWSSGSVAVAPSGAAFLKGPQWKAWEGALAVSTLKAQQLKIFSINKQNNVTSETTLFANQFGRLRGATLGLDGSLYITTDNSSNDQIIRFTPH